MASDSATSSTDRPTDTPNTDVNLVVLRGRVVDRVDLRSLPTGEDVASFDVATRPPEGGTTDTVPVVCHRPPAMVRRLAPGAGVVVLGRVRRRFFRSGGRTQARTEVVAERVMSLRSARQIEGVRDVVERVATDL